MKIKTIQDKICVKPDAVETKTAGGIFIPDNAKDTPVKGVVVSVGTGSIASDGTVVPLNVSEGDTIVYAKGAGETVETDDETFVIITENQIIAIVE